MAKLKRMKNRKILVRIALLPLIIHHGRNVNINVNALSIRAPLHMTSGKQSPTTASIPPSNVLATGSTTTSVPPLEDTNRSKQLERKNTYRKNNDNDNNSNNNNRTRTKAKGAPLVDSTLLRFLSAQKNEMAKRSVNVVEEMKGDEPQIESISSPITIERVVSDDEEEVNVNVDRDEGTNTYRSTPDDEIESSEMQVKTQANDQKDEVTNAISMAVGDLLSSSSSSSSKVQDTNAENLKWFTQYNAQCVAKKLVVLGVPQQTAMEAGNAVQNYSLARTTRQRVRKFLRDRDLKWASGGSEADSSSSKSNAFDEDAFKSDSYNIDDVISFLRESGLTGIDIAAIFTHTPSVSMMRARRSEEGSNGSVSATEQRRYKGETLEDTLNRAYFGVLCTTIKLRKYDARKVLRTCPGLLTKRGSSSCEEVMTIISSLGVSPTSLCRDKKALPMLLSRSPASLFRFVAFLSSDAIRMPIKNIGPFIRRSECASILDQVAPLPRYNSNLLNGGDDFADDDDNDDNSLPLERLLNSGGNRKLQDEVTKTYNQMFKSARFLREEIGIRDLGKILVSHPSLFTTDSEEKMIPIVNYLYDLGLEEDDVPRVLESYPDLIEANPSQMQSVVDFLLDLEVSERILPSIFRAFPSLLVQDTETTMKEVVDYLQEIGVTNIGRFIIRLPPVLGYSVEKDLAPKWNYLNSVCQFSSFEVSKFPAYFAYPLDRIKSRYEYLGKVKRFPVQLQPVDEILRYGDYDFATIVAYDADGSNYAKYVTARNSAIKSKSAAAKAKKNKNKRNHKRVSSNINNDNAKNNRKTNNARGTRTSTMTSSTTKE